VHRIIHRDLQLKCVKRRRALELFETNRVARLTRCKQLLNRYGDPAVDFTWFTDEKVFTVEPLFKSQNDRVYAPVGTKIPKKRHNDHNRLLRTRLKYYSAGRLWCPFRCRVKNGRQHGFLALRRPITCTEITCVVSTSVSALYSGKSKKS